MRRASLWFLLFLLGCAGIASAGEDYVLRKEWEVPIGPPVQALVSVCVDPNGQVHVVDGEGNWTVVSPRGAVTRREEDSQFRGANSTACAPDGHIYVGVGFGRVHEFSSNLERINSFRMVHDRLYVSSSGHVYGVRWAERNIIARRRAGTDALEWFGAFPDAPDRRAVIETVSHQAYAVINEEQGRIIYKPDFPYVFYVFDLEGNLAERIVPDEANRHLTRTALGPAPDSAHPTRTGAFFQTRDGCYVLDVRGRWLLLDANLREVAAPYSTSMGGLVAKDNQDNLYGLVGAPTLRLIKARLEPMN